MYNKKAYQYGSYNDGHGLRFTIRCPVHKMPEEMLEEICRDTPDDSRNWTKYTRGEYTVARLMES